MHVLSFVVLVFRLSLGLTALNQIALPSSKEHLPDGYSQAHHLSKRESPCIYFFLLEPPSSLQCNPQVENTLILTCKFLTSVVAPLRIGWFFSLDGRVGELIQDTRFEAEITFSAFTNKLVVLNALPGAYFCSVAIQGRIFDSRALLITQATIQDTCYLGQDAVIQPAPPRCAQQIAINPSTIRDLVRIKSTVTNTVNLQSGVNIPTPTYSAEFERTIPPIVIATPTTTQLEVIITTATPQLVGVTQPRQQSNTIGIGIGVGIGIAVLLGVLVTALVVGSICFIKKRERNQFLKQAQANTEPLLTPALTPPNRPPPLLQGNAQGEQIELMQYTATEAAPAGPMPLPYEKIGTGGSRYSSEPIGEKVLQPELELRGSQTSDIYYSRPKFYSSGRISSTSTHIINGSDSSSMYISPQQLEPFHPTIGTSREVTANELMLSDVEESTGYTSSDFLPSGSSEEEESYTDGSGGELLSLEYTIEEPSKWFPMDGKTGQALEESNQPTYMNTQQEVVGYVNARDQEVGYTKSAPIKKKKVKKINSHPAPRKESEKDTYTGIIPENLNYTSVYSSTVQSGRQK